MRIYLKILEQYEKDRDSFKLCVDYLDGKLPSFAKSLCEGEEYLPSFMLLKKLQTKFKALCEQDLELNDLFNNSIICSKLFYAKVVKLISQSKADQENFDKRFEQEVHPLGQGLVNILVSIRYRIRVANISLGKFKYSSRSKKPFAWGRVLYGRIYNMLYKTSLLIASNHGLGRKLYYILTLSAISLVWVLNFVFLHDMSPIISTVVNIVAGISIILFSIANYPLWDFGKIDISGKNIVSYHYRLFFNSKVKSK